MSVCLNPALMDTVSTLLVPTTADATQAFSEFQENRPALVRINSFINLEIYLDIYIYRYIIYI